MKPATMLIFLLIIHNAHGFSLPACLIQNQYAKVAGMKKM